MTDQSDVPPNQEPGSDSWQEIGHQFQMLGAGLATAFRTVWEKKENHQRLHELRQGLNDMATQVSQAVKETASSPESQKFKQEVSQAAVSLKDSASQAADEARPHLISALQQVNDELQKIIDRLGSETGPKSS